MMTSSAWVLLMFFGVQCVSPATGEDSPHLICYYCIPDSGGSPQPESIDPNLCTHILVAFARVVNNTLMVQNDSDIEIYSRLMKLKQRNPSLFIILSVGGADNAVGFPPMVRSVDSRLSFINQAIPFLYKYEFDGFNIDWEFPGDVLYDKYYFVDFLKSFKVAAELFAKKYRKAPLLLSADVAAVKGLIESGYVVHKMARYVDFVNIMCYDYHFYLWYLPFTGHNSPLLRRSSETGYFSTLHTAWSAKYWASLGMPKSKIHIGIPTYGHSFKLANSEDHGLDAPATDYGVNSGWVTYTDVCELLKNGWTDAYDEESQVPYAYNDTDWVSYDDRRSLAAKSIWAVTHDYAGVMVFDLNSDDWNQTCDTNTAYPLHWAVHNALYTSN